MKKLIFAVGAALLVQPINTQNTWKAELYDRASDYQYHACLISIAQLPIASDHIRTIIELGCATANLSNTIARMYPDKLFIGIDPSHDCIAYAQKKHAHTHNLTLICDSAQTYNRHAYNMPLADLILCYHTLHWIPRKDMQHVFDTIAAHLAPAGIVDITTCALQGKSRLSQAVLVTMMQPSWRFLLPHIIHNSLTLLTAQELHEYATKSGLIVDHCEQKEECAQFACKQEFALWLRCALMPYGIDTLDESDQDIFTQKVADAYCKMSQDIDTSCIEYCFKNIYLTAHKPL